MKLPVPLPLVVWLLLTVGFCEVFQHTPFAVTLAPPLLLTFPPQVADVVPILLILLVVIVGRMGFTTTVTLAVLVPQLLELVTE